MTSLRCSVWFYWAKRASQSKRSNLHGSLILFAVKMPLSAYAPCRIRIQSFKPWCQDDRFRCQNKSWLVVIPPKMIHMNNEKKEVYSPPTSNNEHIYISNIFWGSPAGELGWIMLNPAKFRPVVTLEPFADTFTFAVAPRPSMAAHTACNQKRGCFLAFQCNVFFV